MSGRGMLLRARLPVSVSDPSQPEVAAVFDLLLKQEGGMSHPRGIRNGYCVVYQFQLVSPENAIRSRSGFSRQSLFALVVAVAFCSADNDRGQR